MDQYLLSLYFFFQELVRNVVVYPGGRLDINLNYRDELEAMLKEAEAPIDAP